MVTYCRRKYPSGRILFFAADKDGVLRRVKKSDVKGDVGECPVVRSKKDRKVSATKTKKCASSHIINPKTGRCVLKTGPTGKKLLAQKKKSKSPSRPPKSRVIADEDTMCGKKHCTDIQICNPKTKRCVLKKGAIGKRLLAGSVNPEKKLSKKSTKKSSAKKKKENVIDIPKIGKKILKSSTKSSPVKVVFKKSPVKKRPMRRRGRELYDYIYLETDRDEYLNMPYEILEQIYLQADVPTKRKIIFTDKRKRNNVTDSERKELCEEPPYDDRFMYKKLDVEMTNIRKKKKKTKEDKKLYKQYQNEQERLGKNLEAFYELCDNFPPSTNRTLTKNDVIIDYGEFTLKNNKKYYADAPFVFGILSFDKESNSGIAELLKVRKVFGDSSEESDVLDLSGLSYDHYITAHINDPNTEITNPKTPVHIHQSIRTGILYDFKADWECVKLRKLYGPSSFPDKMYCAQWASYGSFFPSNRSDEDFGNLDEEMKENYKYFVVSDEL